jgi:hypothetical protein
LVLRSINSARSAFLAVTLSAQFFESYNLFASTGLVQAGVLLKVRGCVPAAHAFIRRGHKRATPTSNSSYL